MRSDDASMNYDVAVTAVKIKAGVVSYNKCDIVNSFMIVPTRRTAEDSTVEIGRFFA
jgi:hypothetical protein